MKRVTGLVLVPAITPPNGVLSSSFQWLPGSGEIVFVSAGKGREFAVPPFRLVVRDIRTRTLRPLALLPAPLPDSPLFVTFVPPSNERLSFFQLGTRLYAASLDTSQPLWHATWTLAEDASGAMVFLG